jgi:hypothetical protein
MYIYIYMHMHIYVCVYVYIYMHWLYVYNYLYVLRWFRDRNIDLLGGFKVYTVFMFVPLCCSHESYLNGNTGFFIVETLKLLIWLSLGIGEELRQRYPYPISQAIVQSCWDEMLSLMAVSEHRVYPFNRHVHGIMIKRSCVHLILVVLLPLNVAIPMELAGFSHGMVPGAWSRSAALATIATWHCFGPRGMGSSNRQNWYYIRNLNPAKFLTTHIVCGMTWRHLNVSWRHLICYSLLAPFRDDVSYLYVVFQHAKNETTFEFYHLCFINTTSCP